MNRSRWERWDRWPYRVIAVVLLLAGQAPRFLTFHTRTGQNVAAVVSLLLIVAGVVLLIGPWWHRIRKRQAEEIKRNPTGKTVSLDDRLARMDHPRARWVGMLAVALVFALGTAWATWQAIRDNDSAFVGFAIYLFIPVPLFGWMAWRTRSLLRRRP